MGFFLFGWGFRKAVHGVVTVGVDGSPQQGGQKVARRVECGRKASCERASSKKLRARRNPPRRRRRPGIRRLPPLRRRRAGSAALWTFFPSPMHFPLLLFLLVACGGGLSNGFPHILPTPSGTRSISPSPTQSPPNRRAGPWITPSSTRQETPTNRPEFPTSIRPASAHLRPAAAPAGGRAPRRR